MAVVHRAYGFRFVIYTFDHEPAHLHITGAGQASTPAKAAAARANGAKGGRPRKAAI